MRAALFALLLSTPASAAPCGGDFANACAERGIGELQEVAVLRGSRQQERECDEGRCEDAFHGVRGVGAESPGPATSASRGFHPIQKDRAEKVFGNTQKVLPACSTLQRRRSSAGIRVPSGTRQVSVFPAGIRILVTEI